MNIQTALKLVHEAHRNYIDGDATITEAVEFTISDLSMRRVSSWPTDTPFLCQLRDAHMLVIRTFDTNPTLLTAWIKQLTPVAV